MKTIIMAGGKSTRLGIDMEKPILPLGGRPLLDWPIEAIEGSTASDLIIATSKWTPLTRSYAEGRGIEIIDAPGIDYHEDLAFLINRFGNFISVNVDVPFIRAQTIDYLLSRINEKSLSCVVPSEMVRFQLSYQSIFTGNDGKPYIWAGLNFVTPDPIGDYLVIDDILLAVNINTLEDLSFAQRIISEKP